MHSSIADSLDSLATWRAELDRHVVQLGRSLAEQEVLESADVALLGALFGGFHIQYPAFNLDGLKGVDTGKLLFPILFITVACGACSGFHGIVSAGTTSRTSQKQRVCAPVP
jgi:carbon starvation protein CstA